MDLTAKLLNFRMPGNDNLNGIALQFSLSAFPALKSYLCTEKCFHHDAS